MPSYKVLSAGFFGGVYRSPGSKHDPVVTEKPLNPVPRWLEEIKFSAADQKKKTTVSNAKKEDFMGSDPDVQTL